MGTAPSMPLAFAAGAAPGEVAAVRLGWCAARWTVTPGGPEVAGAFRRLGRLLSDRAGAAEVAGAAGADGVAGAAGVAGVAGFAAVRAASGAVRWMVASAGPEAAGVL
ncbi:hypothetical protein ACFY4I_38595 [Streptomyces scabiei]|uniref:hypothetical protein n=1 Tax=Streptomyces scabiei TaxID=1930 RepID=UPI0036B80736